MLTSLKMTLGPGWRQVEGHVHGEAYNQALSQVVRHIWYQAWAQVRGKVRGQVEQQARDSIWAQIELAVSARSVLDADYI